MEECRGAGRRVREGPSSLHRTFEARPSMAPSLLHVPAFLRLTSEVKRKNCSFWFPLVTGCAKKSRLRGFLYGFFLRHHSRSYSRTFSLSTSMSMQMSGGMVIYAGARRWRG